MPAKKTPKNTQSKSDFIRQYPTLSAAEIIAAGEKAGLKISGSLVYMVRGRAAKAKKPAVQKTPTAPKAGAPATAPAMSKAEFVRARAHLSPKEIVEDAKAAGIELGVDYVYNVRGSAKKVGRKEIRAAARRSTERVAPPVARPITTASRAEDLLRAVAAEVGLGRAVELLQAERARVRGMIRSG